MDLSTGRVVLDRRAPHTGEFVNSTVPRTGGLVCKKRKNTLIITFRLVGALYLIPKGKPLAEKARGRIAG